MFDERMKKRRSEKKSEFFINFSAPIATYIYNEAL
jgi:hypothetical protein